MSYCGLCMGGWVGGWVVHYLAEIAGNDAFAVHPTFKGSQIRHLWMLFLFVLVGVSGWVGGWVGERPRLFFLSFTHPPTHPPTHLPREA